MAITDYYGGLSGSFGGSGYSGNVVATSVVSVNTVILAVTVGSGGGGSE